jgi:diguanylate cyclase (GGDEF)-like protein/PAS domain S-box-containing protein
MSDLVLETIRAMIVCSIFVYLWLVGRKEDIHRQKGWLYLLFGFAFILFGMLIDITDNFPNLNKYIIIGDTEYQAFLEKVVGYLFGFIVLAIGFWKWIPIIVSVRETEKELKRSHKILELEVKERTAELMMNNERLQREIEERKRAEEALRESEEKLNAMLQSIGDHMSMMDKDLNIIWANETAKKVFGDDIIGKKCFEVYHQRKEPCEPYPCLTLKAFQDGKIHEHDTQVVDKDGKIISFHCIANVALKNKKGKPTAVIEISKDITKWKRAEKALRESEKMYRELSIRDSLTKLYNSRHFFSQLKAETRRADRYSRPLSLLLLDIDNFKHYNDRYGHLEGDKVLAKIGEVLLESLRETDSAYRYGGEELTVILSETSSKEATNIAERIRKRFETETFYPTSDKAVHATVCIGVAQYICEEELTVFIKRADNAMYVAKKKGKNRVFFSK